MVIFENIKKSYGDQAIVNDFNLTIDRGEFVTVIGTSGSGKTTILKMINGLILPDEGTIYVNGENIMETDLIQLRRNIGYAIQGNVLFPHMTIEKNISYVPNLLNRKNKEKTKEAVKKWLGVVDMDEDILDRYPDELSGGQQQRVGIIRALAASPDILLMDEPFGAVDEITRSQLQDEIIKIHKNTGVTIVFVTHDIKEALKLGTKVLVMNQGSIVQYDTPEQVAGNPADEFVERLIGSSEGYLQAASIN